MSHGQKSERAKKDPPLLMGHCLSGARRFAVIFSPLRYSSTTSHSLRSLIPRASFTSQSSVMASTSLPASVAALSLQSTEQQSQFPGCFPTLNPMDIYRARIATKISKVLSIDAAKVYPRIAWTSALDKGDLSLPVRNTLHWAHYAFMLVRTRCTNIFRLS